jgi:hypothetical protein
MNKNRFLLICDDSGAVKTRIFYFEEDSLKEDQNCLSLWKVFLTKGSVVDSPLEFRPNRVERPMELEAVRFDQSEMSSFDTEHGCNEVRKGSFTGNYTTD